MMTINAICATTALGALRSSPHIFLRHDLDLQPPDVRLKSKILKTISIIAAKPPSHPLYQFYAHAKTTKPAAHKGPLHMFLNTTTGLNPAYPDDTQIQHPHHEGQGKSNNGYQSPQTGLLSNHSIF